MCLGGAETPVVAHQDVVEVENDKPHYEIYDHHLDEGEVHRHVRVDQEDIVTHFGLTRNSGITKRKLHVGGLVFAAGANGDFLVVF